MATDSKVSQWMRLLRTRSRPPLVYLSPNWAFHQTGQHRASGLLCGRVIVLNVCLREERRKVILFSMESKRIGPLRAFPHPRRVSAGPQRSYLFPARPPPKKPDGSWLLSILGEVLVLFGERSPPQIVRACSAPRTAGCAPKRPREKNAPNSICRCEWKRCEIHSFSSIICTCCFTFMCSFMCSCALVQVLPQCVDFARFYCKKWRKRSPEVEKEGFRSFTYHVIKMLHHK